MSGAPELFVFKQSYKSRNLSSTRVLNQKHLIYIATRPGVMCNPECGFGLWGKLPGMKASQNIDDLKLARKEIGEASEGHTLYRAILSVDQDTAGKYDLHERGTWQSLVNSRISILQREMHIKPQDFRWVASMHYKKSHPHVHIIYWDAGKEPRPEFIPQKRFDEISDQVRSTFSGALYYSSELSTIHDEQTATVKEARLHLAALLRSANIADALNLDRIPSKQLDTLGQQLVALASSLPTSGRLKYKLLPTAYRQQLDAYLDAVLAIPEFNSLSKQYLKLSLDVTRLYGNNVEQTEKFLGKSKEKLYAELGNETLAALKDVALQLEIKSPPKDLEELYAVTQVAVRQLLRIKPEYAQLLHSLPTHMTPTRVIMSDSNVKSAVDKLTRELTGDLRIRSKVKGYLKQQKTAESEKDATQTDTAEKDIGKKESDTKKKEAYRTLYCAVNAAVIHTMRVDKGYDQESARQTVIMTLLRLFRSSSQEKNHMQSQCDVQRERYRNLSETAKRDLMQKKQQEGDWSIEI